MHRMNPAGAFHIRPGQQACWQMGTYHDMEALVQAAPIEGTRDDANDFKRAGPMVRGDFGVHHHWGYDYPHDDAGRSSAGCLVGRSKDGHNQFIALLKTDARYRADHNFMWPASVLLQEWVNGQATQPDLRPAPPPSSGLNDHSLSDDEQRQLEMHQAGRSSCHRSGRDDARLGL
jgi:hypothetical protein